MKANRIETVTFFDGVEKKEKCSTRNDYWFGSPDAEIYLQAYISFIHDEKEVTIHLFNPSSDQIRKPLSDFKSPDKGFDKEDLSLLSELFEFKTFINKNDVQTAFSSGYPMELIIKKQEDDLYFLIYSIYGGRAPESLYLHGVYYVGVDSEFFNKYLKNFKSI